MKQESQRIIRVAVGIILRERKILCCQRRKDARYPLQWEFPGGKLNDGESPVECLIRELREELGISITEPVEYDRHTTVYEDSGKFEVHYYLVTAFTGEPRNRTFERILWLKLSELSQVQFLKGNLSVIEKLRLNPPESPEP